MAIEAQVEAFESYEEIGPQSGLVFSPAWKPLGNIPAGQTAKTFNLIKGTDTDMVTIGNTVNPDSTVGTEPPQEWLDVTPKSMTVPINTWLKVYFSASPPLEAAKGHYGMNVLHCIEGGIRVCAKSITNFDVVDPTPIPPVRIVKGCYTPASGEPKCFPIFTSSFKEGVSSTLGIANIHNNSDIDRIHNQDFALKFLDKDTNETYNVSLSYTWQAWQIVQLSFGPVKFYKPGTHHWQFQIFIGSQLVDAFDFDFEVTDPIFGYLQVKAYENEKELQIPIAITPGDLLNYTPFWIPLPPGNYHLVANYNNKIQEEDVAIELGKQADVNFQFGVPPTKGTLDVKAFEDSTELQIPVTITPGDQTLNTPFMVDLDVGSYHLRADNLGKIQEKDAIITSQKTTSVTFQWGLPPPPQKLLNVAFPMITGITLMTVGEKAFKEGTLKLFKK
jgi:hypothetical protein